MVTFHVGLRCYEADSDAEEMTVGDRYEHCTAGQPGQIPVLPLADVGAALFAAIAILSVQRTGQGRCADVSISDGAVSMRTAFLVPAANGTALGKFIAEPAYGVFTCKDGELMTRSFAHDGGKAETFLVQPLKCAGFESLISGVPPEIRADNESVVMGGSD